MEKKYSILHEEKWQDIRNNPFYKEMIDEVAREAKEHLCDDYDIPDELFDQYYIDGNRLAYETEYFKKRKKLCAFTLMYKISKEKVYLKALESTIKSICNEYTWALPAHTTRENTIEKRKTLDLFACETGYYLSEISMILRDELSIDIMTLIERNVRDRIIDSFMYTNTDNWWEHKPMNWAAVCACGITHVFVYKGTEKEVDSIIDRVINCAKVFLDSFSDDGACMEGYGYYMYGFTFFIQMAETLYEYTDGKINLYNNEKVKKIAEFSNKIRMGKSKIYSFSDAATDRFIFDIGLNSRLCSRYNSIRPFNSNYRTTFYDDPCYRFGTFIRNFIWTDCKLYEDVTEINEDVYYEDAGIFIKNNRHYSCAIKAGDNDEPHNHNDVGSLCVYANDKCIICDIGAGEYTKDYFDNSKRYDYIVTSSRGHSVPIINGRYEAYGKTSEADMTVIDDNCVKISYADAYQVEGMNELERVITFDENTIKISDRAEFNSMDKVIFEDRLVTKIEPKCYEGYIKLDNMTIYCKTSDIRTRISCEEYSNHMGVTEKVYFIDYIYEEDNSKSVLLDLILCIM